MAILRPARVQNRNRRLARVRQIFPGRLQARFWTTVDALEAFIKISGANFGEQMELVDREIEERLTCNLGNKARRIPYLQRIRLVPNRYTIRKKSAALGKVGGAA